MAFNLIRTAALALLLCVGLAGLNHGLMAQEDGGGGPAIPPGDTGGTPTNPQVPQQPQQDQGGESSISEGEGLGEITTFNIEQSEDTRNQGFVGATAADVIEFYPGAATEGTGSPLVDGQDFGGGVNDAVNSPFGGGAGGGGRQGLGGVTDNGVTITRRSIRARLRPQFYAPRRSGDQVLDQFNRHFYRQPTARNVTGQFAIKIENRTAFLNGTIQSKQDMDKLVRQLRLQPGVYKIVNNLKVSPQSSQANRYSAPVYTSAPVHNTAPVDTSARILAQPTYVHPAPARPVYAQPVNANPVHRYTAPTHGTRVVQ